MWKTGTELDPIIFQTLRMIYELVQHKLKLFSINIFHSKCEFWAWVTLFWDCGPCVTVLFGRTWTLTVKVALNPSFEFTVWRHQRSSLTIINTLMGFEEGAAEDWVGGWTAASYINRPGRGTRWPRLESDWYDCSDVPDTSAPVRLKTLKAQNVEMLCVCLYARVRVLV